jgi:hypothetical protein
MALKTFECKFITFLHAPTDQDGIDNLMGHRRHVLNAFAEYVVDHGELLSKATFEKVREACIGFALLDFYRDGIDGSCLDVVLGGWQAFSLRDFVSIKRLCSIIIGASLVAE